MPRGPLAGMQFSLTPPNPPTTQANHSLTALPHLPDTNHLAPPSRSKRLPAPPAHPQSVRPNTHEWYRSLRIIRNRDLEADAVPPEGWRGWPKRHARILFALGLGCVCGFIVTIAVLSTAVFGKVNRDGSGS